MRSMVEGGLHPRRSWASAHALRTPSTTLRAVLLPASGEE